MRTLLGTLLMLLAAMTAAGPAYAGTGGPYDGGILTVLIIIAVLLAGLLWCCYSKRGL